MRVGLIARADNRGLGQQTWEFARHMHPAKTMVIDCPSLKPLPLHYDRFPNATWVHRFPAEPDFEDWLPGLDVVYTAETPYHPSLFSIAERLGIKTVLHLNYELFDYTQDRETRFAPLARPSVFAAPSRWHWDDIPNPKVFLPVPVALDRFTPNQSSRATRFLHVVGRPAANDRNGTQDLLQALQLVTSEIVVTIKCQEPGYVQPLQVPDNVTLIIDSGDVPNYWDLYQGQDVLILPRRFGGLCLPVNEALAAGMPVIMPDISPNEWLPSDWLVGAHQTARFMAHNLIDLHAVEPRHLAARIDMFASDPGFYSKAAAEAREIAGRMSWQALKPVYEDVLCG